MCHISLRSSLLCLVLLLASSLVAEDRQLVIYESELIELEKTISTLKEVTSQLQIQLLESKTAQERSEKELMELSIKHEQSMKASTELFLHWKEYEKEVTSKINHLQSQVAVRDVLIWSLAGVSLVLGFGGMFFW